MHRIILIILTSYVSAADPVDTCQEKHPQPTIQGGYPTTIGNYAAETQLPNGVSYPHSTPGPELVLNYGENIPPTGTTNYPNGGGYPIITPLPVDTCSEAIASHPTVPPLSGNYLGVEGQLGYPANGDYLGVTAPNIGNYPSDSVYPAGGDQINPGGDYLGTPPNNGNYPIPDVDNGAIPAPNGDYRAIPAPNGDYLAVPAPNGDYATIPAPIGDYGAVPTHIADYAAIPAPEIGNYPADSGYPVPHADYAATPAPEIGNYPADSGYPVPNIDYAATPAPEIGNYPADSGYPVPVSNGDYAAVPAPEIGNYPSDSGYPAEGGYETPAGDLLLTENLNGNHHEKALPQEPYKSMPQPSGGEGECEEGEYHAEECEEEEYECDEESLPESHGGLLPTPAESFNTYANTKTYANTNTFANTEAAPTSAMLPSLSDGSFISSASKLPGKVTGIIFAVILLGM